MKAATEERGTRRVVVVFGGGSSDTSVAGVLASLVPERGADIMGLFLEDHILFRLAELPFTTEVCRITSMQRPLTTGELERQMKIQALHAKQAVRQVAEQVGSSWSFRKHRGPLSTALAEARDVDLLLVGACRRALAPAGELRATARTDDVESQRPVAVLIDQVETTGPTLDAGIELADRTGRALIVLLSERAAEVYPTIVERLQPFGPKRAAVRKVPRTGPQALLAAVRRAAPAVLVVSAGETGFEEPRIDALQRELRCPMVVVR